MQDNVGEERKYDHLRALARSKTKAGRAQRHVLVGGQELGSAHLHFGLEPNRTRFRNEKT